MTGAVETGDVDSLKRAGLAVLAGIVALYVVFRLPFVLEQLSGQDEHFFSVPGLMIARGGVPSIPYLPSRDPQGYFYKADEILLEMPPALFFLQAPFFLVMPPGVAAARMPSLLAGAIAIVLVYQLGRRAFGPVAALFGSGCYAFSRVLFFAATFARPDELCAAFGLGALVLTWDALERSSRKRLAAAGIALGLGLLSHPFAISYCLLCGVWVLATTAPLRERILRATVLTGTTLLVFALWIPLILHSPDIFRHQFFNTMNLTGPGLMTRLAWPWPYIPHQIGLLRAQAGDWQACAMIAGLLISTVSAIMLRRPSMTKFVALTWGALYFLTACQGAHVTKGYWAFTGALLMVNLGFLASLAAALLECVTSRSANDLQLPADNSGRAKLPLSRLQRTPLFFKLVGSGNGCPNGPFSQTALPAWRRVLSHAAVALLLAGLFVPESGLRMWRAHVRTDPEARYDGPRFTRAMLAELPREGRYIVEPAFILDVWLSGRDAIVRVDEKDYEIDHYTYDWLLVSRDGLDKSIPDRLKGRLVRSFGVKDDPLACYAELYAPRAP